MKTRFQKAKGKRRPGGAQRPLPQLRVLSRRASNAGAFALHRAHTRDVFAYLGARVQMLHWLYWLYWLYWLFLSPLSLQVKSDPLKSRCSRDKVRA